MAIKSVISVITGFLRKYKYPLIALTAGIVLLIMPNLFETKETGKEYSQMPDSVQQDIYSEIEEILSTVEGVGKVRVMVSVAAGETNIYQTDDRITQNEDSTSSQSTTIIVSDAQRVQSGLIKQVIPKSYRGAIIVCEGADSPSVRLAVIEAVSKVTGLNSNQISVMKMK